MTPETTTTTRQWSDQQAAIFDWFENPAPLTATIADRIWEKERPARESQNLIVRARAGTGKTTTIIEGVNRAPELRILVCAFNKRIAEELTQRLRNFNAVAKTLHSVGFAAVVRYWSGVRPDGSGVRADSLSERVCGPRCPDTVKKLVSKLHTKGREIAPHARNLGDLSDLLITFECEPDEQWVAEGYDNEYVEFKALEAMDLAAREKPADRIIDFADMIFLPVRNGWLQKSYDLVVVDEAQDMTVAQLEIARGVCRGRICVVGDDRQAIYGFRGADSGSLDRLKNELHAAELGLTTTYRCGHSIVELARTLVPDFEAGPDNPKGVISDLAEDKLVAEIAHGDFLLSRINAPLVKTAMALLRSGKRARIAGRDIGAGLRTLVRKLAKGAAANSVPVFIERIGSWRDRETARIMPQLQNERTRNAAENKLTLVEDQAAMLTELAEGALSVRDVEARIDALFTDDGLGAAGIITCSSVHRAKGLEADRVFVLAWTIRDNTQEEQNIKYVAVTRAKSSLVWVRKGMV